MGAIIFFNFYLLKLKVIAENQCVKHKKIEFDSVQCVKGFSDFHAGITQ